MPSSPPEETSAERSISSNIARWGTKGPSARSPAARYAFAVFAASAGILISLWLRPFSYGTPFLYLYPMVLIAVWFGGFWPGLVATVLTSLGANYFFLAPYNHFSLDTAGLIRTLMFAFAFASLCYFIDLARAQLEARLQERTAE